VVDDEGLWQGVPVVDMFQTGAPISLIATQLESIVMIDHDEVQLWIVKQEMMPSGLRNRWADSQANQLTKTFRNGQLLIQRNGQFYNATGQTIQ